VPDEKVEALVRALLAAFEAWGGVPLCSVFDNPKTIVLGRRDGRIEWNSTFAQTVVDYGLGVELCTPRRANQKGAVENLVGWVKGSFFKVRRFHDREDAVGQLAEWLVEVNTRRPSRATGEVPAVRRAAEAERLKPLAIPPQEYALRFPVTVRTTGFVEHAGIRYSMPPETIGIPATLLLYPDRVRIVTRNGVEAAHPRTPAVGTASYRPEDRVAKLAAVHGRRGRLYLQRQEILELGPPAEALLTESTPSPTVPSRTATTPASPPPPPSSTASPPPRDKAPSPRPSSPTPIPTSWSSTKSATSPTAPTPPTSSSRSSTTATCAGGPWSSPPTSPLMSGAGSSTTTTSPRPSPTASSNEDASSSCGAARTAHATFRRPPTRKESNRVDLFAPLRYPRPSPSEPVRISGKNRS